MPNYPICDWCGLCEHCPEHGPECVHPCKDCRGPISFDQPVCFDRHCPSNREEWDEMNRYYRCTCGETACESELCDCDDYPCPAHAERKRDSHGNQTVPRQALDSG